MHKIGSFRKSTEELSCELFILYGRNSYEQLSIQKAAFMYRLPIDDDTDPVLETVYDCIVASTMLGSLFVMIPLTSEEHQLLQDVQERLSVHPLTAPVLGNDHAEFRQRGAPSVVPPILDGDMLMQFLELTGEQQQAILTHTLPGKLPKGLDIRAGCFRCGQSRGLSELCNLDGGFQCAGCSSLPLYLSECLIDDATGA